MTTSVITIIVAFVLILLAAALYKYSNLKKHTERWRTIVRE